MHIYIFLCNLFEGLISFSYLFIRFLKSVDRFNDLVVSVYVTAGHILFFFNCNQNSKRAIHFFSFFFLLIHLNSLRFVCWVQFFKMFVSTFLNLSTHTRLMLLHDSRNEDGIKSFFQEVHELYIKVQT